MSIINALATFLDKNHERIGHACGRAWPPPVVREQLESTEVDETALAQAVLGYLADFAELQGMADAEPEPLKGWFNPPTRGLKPATPMGTRRDVPLLQNHLDSIRTINIKIQRVSQPKNNNAADTASTNSPPKMRHS